MRYAVLITESGQVRRVIPEKTTDIETARLFRAIVDGSYSGDDLEIVVTSKTPESAARAARRQRVREIREFCRENDLDLADFVEEVGNLEGVK